MYIFCHLIYFEISACIKLIYIYICTHTYFKIIHNLICMYIYISKIINLFNMYIYIYKLKQFKSFCYIHAYKTHIYIYILFYLCIIFCNFELEIFQ